MDYARFNYVAHLAGLQTWFQTSAITTRAIVGVGIAGKHPEAAVAKVLQWIVAGSTLPN